MAAQLLTRINRYLVATITDAPSPEELIGSRAYAVDTQLWYIWTGAAWVELTDETVIASMGGDLTGPATAAVVVGIGGELFSAAAPNLDITANPPATLILPAVAVHSVGVPTQVEYNATVDKFNALLGIVRSLIDRDALLGLVT